MSENGKKQLFIVVAGCGRLGSYIASTLSAEGHSLVVLDHRAASFANLSGEFSGFTLEGDATEFDVLVRAKMERADVVVAATDSDTVNMLVAEVAQARFGVERVMARVFDQGRQQLCSLLGIKTVSPSGIVGNIFLQNINAVARGEESLWPA